MIKITTALALLGAFVPPAFALPCVALEYQEMKDMPVNDLVTEACKAQKINDLNFEMDMRNLETRRGPKPYPGIDGEILQCNGQVDRMTRILNSKGVTEKLPALCKQQAAGQTITAPGDAK